MRRWKNVDAKIDIDIYNEVDSGAGVEVEEEYEKQLEVESEFDSNNDSSVDINVRYGVKVKIDDSVYWDVDKSVVDYVLESIMKGYTVMLLLKLRVVMVKEYKKL